MPPGPLAEVMMSLRRLVVVVSALVALAPPAAAQAPPSPNVGVNISGITRSQTATLSGVNLEPPDVMGAVGLNNYAEFLNGSFTVYNKAGTQVQRISDGTFWNNAGISGVSTSTLSDPRILYDPASQRWFAVMITTNQATNNNILIARSNTSDPSGSWKAVSLATNGGVFGDYPTLGLTADNIGIGTINFTSTGADAHNISLYTIPKGDITATTPVLTNLTRFNTQSNSTFGFVAQPVVNYGPSAGGTMTVVAPTATTPLNHYVISTLSGVGGAGATLSGATNVSVTSYSQGPRATQPGSSTTLDTIDTRFYTNVIRQGNLLYMANVVGSSSRDAIRFTVVNATTNAVVFQTTFSEANADYFFPAVSVNPSGDVVIGMNLTRTTGNPNGTLNVSPAVIVGSTTNFTSWTFNTPTVLTAGVGTYSGTRWGDYSATTLDPADPGIFWTTQELTPSTGSTTNWGTQITEVIPVKSNEVRWTTTTNGGSLAFTSGANWFGGTAPVNTDHVIFSRWTPNNYTVNLPTGTTTNDRLSVRQTGTGTVTFNIPSGATWSLTNTSATTPSVAVSEFQGQSNVIFSGGGTLLSQYAIIAGQAGGIGSVTVTGAGTLWNNQNDLYLGGTSTAAGGTGTLSITGGAAVQVGGTLKIWQGDGSAVQVAVGTAGAASNLSVGGLVAGPSATPRVDLANANSVLTVTDGLGTTYSGLITGPGRFAKQGAGTFTLTGANTYTGGTTLSAGVLNINNGGTSATNSAIGTGPLTLAGGTIDNTSGSAVALAPNNAQAWNADFAFGGTNALNLGTGAVVLGGAGTARTVTTNGTAPLTVGGTIGGSLGLTKAGTGTLVLGGANTYAGPTTVTGTGTLTLTGSGSVAASPTVTVGTGATLSVSGVTGGANFDAATAQFALASGQTLQGTGTVSGGVTVRPGAVIRGDTGTGTGTLTVAGGLILQGAPGTGGATLTTAVTDSGTLNPNHSTVAATTLNLAIDPTNKLNLILIQGAPTLPQGQQYTATLATTTLGIQLNGVAQSAGTTIDPATYTLTAQGMVIGPVFQLAVDGTGQGLVLTFTPVPEPTTVLGLAVAVGLAGLARASRRTSRRTARPHARAFST
jgi:autotransporter-associated beta strand protein/T5SS/PEP-CTERM-associated repeat protein